MEHEMVYAWLSNKGRKYLIFHSKIVGNPRPCYQNSMLIKAIRSHMAEYKDYVTTIM